MALWFPCPRTHLSLSLSPGSQLSSFPVEKALEEAGKPSCSSGFLPGRLRFLCWLVLGTVGLASGFFTVLYSLQLSRAQATHWATTMVLSVLQGVFLMQPLKVRRKLYGGRGGGREGCCPSSAKACFLPQVLALALTFSLLRKRRLCQDKGQERELQRALLRTGNSSPQPPRRGEGLPRPAALQRVLALSPAACLPVSSRRAPQAPWLQRERGLRRHHLQTTPSAASSVGQGKALEREEVVLPGP